MINKNDHQVKTLLDLGLEEQAIYISDLVSSDDKDYFLFNLIKKYLKLFNFDICLTLSRSIKNQELKEFSFQQILTVYLRCYLGNLVTQEIDHNLIERIRKNIKRINEKSLPKLNQRIKVVNLTLAEEIDKAREVIERIVNRNCYLAVTTIIDIFNLGNRGYRVLLEILHKSKNNQLKQVCYHLFRHQGGHKTKEKIKQYKSETTIIMINGEENYKFQKFKKEDKIIYQRIQKWDEYKIPKFIISGGKFLNRETIRQIFLPYSFLVFVQPNFPLLKEIKKDQYLNKIPIIYPESNSQEEVTLEIAKDHLIKIYKPSPKYLEKISGKQIKQLKESSLMGSINEQEIEEKIAEMDHNISLFIEDMLTQV